MKICAAANRCCVDLFLEKSGVNQAESSTMKTFFQKMELTLEEIVLYDKNDLKNKLSGEFAKYDYSSDLWRVKGAFSSHGTRHNNWRYYHLD